MSDEKNQMALFGANNSAYTADDVEHMDGLDIIRKRPELFIEGLNENGLLRLVNEGLDNAFDEIGAGYGSLINVEIENGGWVTIEDYGRGIPVEINTKYGIPAIELVFTKLFAGGKFGSGGYSASGGLHGVGLKCIAALSEIVDVDVWRGGGHYKFGLTNGLVSVPLERTGDSDRTGTKIRFRPDYALFSQGSVINTSLVEARLKRDAYLNPQVTVVYIAKGAKMEYCYPDGISEYIDEISESGRPLHEDTIKLFAKAGEDMVLEAHMRFTSIGCQYVAGYVNNISTPGGGSHVDAVLKGVQKAIESCAVWKKLISKRALKISAADVASGIKMIASLKTKTPKFTSQTKTTYYDVDAEVRITGIIHGHMQSYLDGHPKTAKAIIASCVASAELRERIKDQKKRMRRLKETTGEGMPPTLNVSKNTGGETSLYVFPRFSGWHKIAACRNTESQAALPMPLGKNLKTKDISLDAILDHADYLALIGAIGAGVGAHTAEKETSNEAGDFNYQDRRYDTVILVPDGTNESRLATAYVAIFLQQQMKDLVINKKVYVLDATSVLTEKGLATLSELKKGDINACVFGESAPLLMVVEMEAVEENPSATIETTNEAAKVTDGAESITPGHHEEEEPSLTEGE